MTPKDSLPTVASDEPVYEIDSFELLWEKHKSKIIAGAVALLVLAVAVFGWLLFSGSQRAAAEGAFAQAKTPADYRAVIDKYPSSPVAGDAALLLAKSLRDEKKYDEANAVLYRFAQAQPKHPFAPLAKVAGAENLALAGKVEQAVEALENTARTDPKSFAAPFAMWQAAELRAAAGKRDEALRAYRELTEMFSASIASRAAAGNMEALQAVAPAPAPAASPAPAKP